MTDIDFNEWYEVGCPVILTDDFGKEHKTATTSKAWNLCGTSVVNCEGFRAYDLARINPDCNHILPVWNRFKLAYPELEGE